MTTALDQAFADAGQQISNAYHIGSVYAKRADQLTRWKRMLDFISLGVAPGILLVVIDKQHFREAGLIIAGLCSTAAYVWAVFTFSFRWERQLEVSQSASTRSRQVVRQLRKLLAEANARKVQPDGKPEELLPSIQKVSDQYEEMYNEISGAGIELKPWMTLMAQQETMLELGTSCSVCGVQWKRGAHRLLTPKQAHSFLKNHQKHFPEFCPTCGLKNK